ncbi:GPALPP motifs-containing protein 1 isoform X2 [Chanos chanos]|uniref:GPALPP motifs-containing protein 1 n=1 Tax=Chanos chanos TaxID=29144 RepID=A0A6J2VZK5_CHACN|nr:GPALPP motifs-containing protein 1 isoform X2 [Chanos chanos]
MSNHDIIGPALPPSFNKAKSDESDEEEAIIGPALPPVYKRTESSSASEDSDGEEVVFKRAKRAGQRDDATPTDVQEEDDGFFGPALPPGYQKQQSSPERPLVLGPALPPGFRRQVDDDDDDDDDDDSDDDEREDDQGYSGPALPPGYKAESSSSEAEDSDIIGPMPVKGPVHDSVVSDIERRAKRMKDKLSGVNDGPEELKREEWMTELPPELQHFGMGPRTFKRRTGPEDKDRSIWTDTPADRERKARERLEGKNSGESRKADAPRVSEKELQIAQQVSKYNESKRGESLIDMHTKKMKAAAEEGEKKPVERRPFDRDTDLQVNRFDDAQKKAVLKKSQELNTRFSHSKDRMFL